MHTKLPALFAGPAQVFGTHGTKLHGFFPVTTILMPLSLVRTQHR